MKRHISIFAFLLSAFAAVGSAAVEPTQTVYGGYYFVEGELNGDGTDLPNKARLSVNGDGVDYMTKLAAGQPVTFKASPEAGLRVAEWGTLILTKNIDQSKRTYYSKYDEWTASTSDSKVWVGQPEAGIGIGYLAVNFKYITYTVKYDANGGSGAPADATGNSYNADFTLSSTKPTKPGYTFDKWKADTNGKTYSSGATVAGSELCKSDWHEDDKVVTMTAQWAGSKYTVTVDRNGGTTDGSCPDYTASADQQTLTFTPPTWEDHVITAWDVTGYSGSKPTVDGNTLTIPVNTYGNLTLKPTWKSSVRKLTVDPNGGKYEGQTIVQDVGKLRPGEKDLNAISVATRDYYSLIGYYLRSDGGTKVYDKDGHNVQCDNYWTADYPEGTFEGTSDLKVYAVWQANAVDVDFDKQGGSGGSDGTKATYQEALPQIVPPTRIGYEFEGYYTGKNGGWPKYYSSDGSSYQKWISMGTTTLYANWTPHGFKIAYELDGGSTGTDAPTSPKVGTDFRVSSPHRTGWTFTGWNVIGAGVDYTTAKWGVSSGAASMPITDASQVCFDPDRDYVYFLDLASEDNAPVTLKANWTRTEYSLTVDPNGGTYRESTGSTTLNEKLFYGLTNLNDIGVATREGYDLRGYYTASNGGEAVYDEKGQGKSGSYWTANYPEGTYKKTESLRVYAQWKIATYAVDYAPGDFAKETARYSDTKEWETDLTLRGSTYTRTGYAQDGWSRASDGSTLDFTLGGTYTANAAVTLYPHWKANEYELTIDPNGGVYDTKDFPHKLSEKLVYDGTDLNQILIATKADHSPLLGYWTATSGGTKVYDAQGRYVVGDYWTADGRFKGTANITAHAMWGEPKKYHDISVSADPEKAGSVEGGGTYEEGSNAVLKATANKGYSFCCWTNGNEVVSMKNPWTNEVTAAAAYTAVFTGNVYKVTFIGMGGLPAATNIDVQVGRKWGEYFPSLIYPIDGWKLTGWYSDPLCTEGNRIADDELVEVSPLSLTPPSLLYAKWEEIPTYTIAYDGNGATSGKMDPQTAVCGEETTLTSNKYARTGYTFAGWTNTVKQAFYADGAKVTDLADADETATLSAVWQANTYTVTFDGNGGLGNMDPPQEFEYDEPQALKANDYKKSPFDFVGWATSKSGAIAYTDKQVVLNLTTGTDITLYAKWGFLNELSIAADCNYERADERQPVDLLADNDMSCKSVAVEGDPGKNGLAVRMMPVTGAPLSVEMNTTLTGPGVLKFHYKTSISNAGSELEVTLDLDRKLLCQQSVSSWTECAFEVPSGDYKVTWNFAVNTRDADFALIDNIRWIPYGVHPVPGPGDEATISSAGISADGKSFSLSFTSKAEFDYNLLTNANLLIKEGWGVMGEKKIGDGSTLTFEPEIIKGQPQLFYKVETIQK